MILGVWWYLTSSRASLRCVDVWYGLRTRLTHAQASGASAEEEFMAMAGHPTPMLLRSLPLQYIADLVQQDGERFMKYLPSAVAAAAVLVAKCVFGAKPADVWVRVTRVIRCVGLSP